MHRDLILLSGGLDSATALAASYEEGTAAYALSVDYGQRHIREIESARALADHFGVGHAVLDLQGWGRLLTGSALTDRNVAVPHGHYADASMAVTVVPGRNATMLAAAAGVAVARGCDRVVTAVHAGDHAVYRDCRPDFIDAIRKAVVLATDGEVSVEAPFLHMDKTGIARTAYWLEVPVGMTWSCYEGGAQHCGRCGTCVERIEALRDAGVDDPTTYAGVPA